MLSSPVRYAMIARAAALLGILCVSVAGPPALCAAADAGVASKQADSRAAVNALQSRLGKGPIRGNALAAKDFAHAPFDQGRRRPRQGPALESSCRADRQGAPAEIEQGLLTDGHHNMPIFLKTFGKEPKEGWSLWISMHGGGRAEAR